MCYALRSFLASFYTALRCHRQQHSAYLLPSWKSSVYNSATRILSARQLASSYLTIFENVHFPPTSQRLHLQGALEKMQLYFFARARTTRHVVQRLLRCATKAREAKELRQCVATNAITQILVIISTKAAVSVSSQTHWENYNNFVQFTASFGSHACVVKSRLLSRTLHIGSRPFRHSYWENIHYQANSSRRLRKPVCKQAVGLAATPRVLRRRA